MDFNLIFWSQSNQGADMIELRSMYDVPKKEIEAHEDLFFSQIFFLYEFLEITRTLRFTGQS
jgi:hypothetical protein